MDPRDDLERHLVARDGGGLDIGRSEEERIAPRQANGVAALLRLGGEDLPDALGRELRGDRMTRRALAHPTKDVGMHRGIEEDEVRFLEHVGGAQSEKPRIS